MTIIIDNHNHMIEFCFDYVHYLRFQIIGAFTMIYVLSHPM